MFKDFIVDAAESAKIGRLTNAVIASTKGVANVTAAAVDKLTQSLSNKTAVDDELIQNAANVLLTFTKVRNEVGKGNDIFNQGTKAALNMSAALGTDLQGATMTIGKALNDPVRGITALTRAGIQFTQQQKDQIKAMVAAGDTLGAQKIILAELETQFGGAAEAAASPLERLKVVTENLGEKVGGFLLPYIERFADFVVERIVPGLEDFIEGFENGTGAGGDFADKIKWVRDKAVELSDWFDEHVQPALTTFSDWINETGLPALEDFGTEMRDGVTDAADGLRTKLAELRPELEKAEAFLRETFTPTWEELNDVWEEDIEPNLAELKAAWEENREPIMQLVGGLAQLVGAFVVLQLKLRALVLPILVEVAGFLSGMWLTYFALAAKAVGEFVKQGEDLQEEWDTVYQKLKRFWDWITNLTLPGWVDTLVGAGRKIAGFFGGISTGDVMDRYGDGPGRGGGNVLAKVRRLMPAGTTVTSTYRTPAQNAAAGGSPRSYHLDQSNPAVDIAGPTRLLDMLHARLAAEGGWRELLWRVKGHYDHVHVAHGGGEVAPWWPRMPGDASDERTARLQVGERVLSRQEAAAGALTPEALAAALDGITFTLLTEAGPIRAIARAEAVGVVRAAVR